ncbi:uncharacterized protein N0V89_009337 [Didymosphaeria variabile]|uniref:DUF8035 domain-containing protein n=1 Tax=Didymosphaeria variabile TaxID=1932322 RepID=A0A9W8XDK0_9PLEO|nr:uncharacterized protein N0V89_009337 [Didymosphaeria variabile]KAJ4347965.1 hypothetical protein N0V89_009337 [Didymosphaeria variabile]
MALKRHVGRHQEQLALFALPPNLEETDGDVKDDGTNSSDAAVNVDEWRDADMSDSGDSDSVDPSSTAGTTEHVQPRMISCLNCHDWRVHEEHERYCPRCGSEDIAPASARWTKIDRRFVNPQALEEAREQFEEREDCCIVLRVLTQEEIQKLADRTKEIREARQAECEGYNQRWIPKPIENWPPHLRGMTKSAEAARVIVKAAQAAREEAEKKAAKEAEDTKAAHKKALEEAKKAQEELEETKKLLERLQS